MTCSNCGEQLLDYKDCCDSCGERRSEVSDRRFKMRVIVCFFALFISTLAIFSLAVKHVPEGNVGIVTSVDADFDGAKILQPGYYPINPLLYKVDIVEMTIIPTGCFVVLKDKDGEVLEDQVPLPPGEHPVSDDFTVEKVDVRPHLMIFQKDGVHRYIPSEDGHWIEIAGEVKRELTPDKTAEFANHFEEEQP